MKSFGLSYVSSEAAMNGRNSLPTFALFLFCLAGLSAGESQTMNTTGSPKYRSAIGAVFTPPFAPGTVLHNVNMQTGQPVYSVPIGEISMGRAHYAFGYSYSGSVRQLFDADNEQGPTSWIGYGWNFSTPFVATYHKGTVNAEDDVFHCNLGQYGGGQLLQAQSGKFYLTSDPAIRVQANKNSDSLITTWEFIFTDGVRMRFGTTVAGDKAERLVNRSGGSILASPFSGVIPISMIYRWDLSIIDGKPFGAASGERLEFRYDRIDIPTGSGVSFTRESYIKEIVAINATGVEVEKYKFTNSAKTTEEYPTVTAERTQDQSRFETRYLSMIEWFPTASPSPQKRVTNVIKIQTAPTFKKMFLDGINIEYRTASGTYVPEPTGNWKFEYETSVAHMALKNIKKGISKEEFEYDNPKYALLGWKERTRQDVNTKNLALSGGGDLQPPTGTTWNANTNANWENKTTCSDRFCFVSALHHDATQNKDFMYLEVWKNNGNYFTLATLAGQNFRLTIPSAYKYSLQLIPWNDNFIVLDSKAKKFTLYEWDGETFQAVTNIIKRKDAAGNIPPISPLINNLPWKIFLGGDFFLVQDDGIKDPCNGAVSNSPKLYVVRKVSGTWKDLNENECTDPSSCVTTNENFGPVYNRWTTGRCLDFNSSNLLVSASQSMFHIVHQSTKVILTFAQNSDGKSFSSISSKYPLVDGAVQLYKNVWNNEIPMPIQSGNDYFVIPSNTGSSGGAPTGQRVDMFHYNGANIKWIGFDKEPTATNKTWSKVWVAGDYFLTLKPTGGGMATLYLHRKSITPATGTPTGMAMTTYPVRTSISLSYDFKVRTHPNAFTLEYYPAGSLTNLGQGKPPLTGNNTYAASIWEFDPLLIPSKGVPFREVTASFKDGFSHNYYDIEFSPMANTIVARSCGTSTTLCNGAAGEQVQFATAKMTPGLAVTGGQFFRKVNNVFQAWGTNSYTHPQIQMSLAYRIAAVSIMNETTKKMEFRLLQSMGDGYTEFPYQAGTSPFSGDITYVSGFKQYSALTGNNRGHWNEFRFSYILGGINILDKNPEYNSLLQTFSFPSSAVTSYKGSEEKTTPVPTDMVSLWHVSDEIDNQIPDQYLGKVGLMLKSRIHDMDGTKGAETIKDELARNESEFYAPTRESVWPDKLFVVRQKKATAIRFAANKSFQTKTTAYNRYNPNNNQPIFSKSNIAGKWYLNQTLYSMTGENKTLPTGSYAFRFDTEPTDANLDGWTDFSIPYNKDGAATKTISAGKVEYDATFPYLQKKTKAWRDVDPTLDDDELKRGVDPIFSYGLGWEERNVVEKRNGYGQPTETRVVMSESPAVSRYTASFYDGARSLLSGTVDNCFLEDALVLTSENGGSSVSHTGKYGMALSVGTSVAAQVSLRGGSTLVNDYVVSVWMQSTTTTHPVLTLKRFQKVIVNGSPTYQEKGTPFTVTDPVGQTFTVGKWQRYEKRLTVAQLKGAENLFATIGSGDYLQIILSVPSGTAFADNVLARPAGSIATLNAYDFMGRLTHTIDNNHFVKSIDYDAFGNVSAIRDERHRIYSSQATHNPGEND